MSQMVGKPMAPAALDIFTAEHDAELTFQSGKRSLNEAIKILQSLMDKTNCAESEIGLVFTRDGPVCLVLR